MTVRYRVLCQPELGPTLGNTVHVGLDVEYEDQLARLLFEGLPRRIDEIKQALDAVPGLRGGGFDTKYKTDARELHSVMQSDAMRAYEPLLVSGAEVFGRLKPLDPAQHSLGGFADNLAYRISSDLDSRWEDDRTIDGSRAETYGHLIRVWQAWRAVKSADEIAHELAPRLSAETARAVADALDANPEPRALFEDLKRRLARPA
jgi:hypothetical protein